MARSYDAPSRTGHHTMLDGWLQRAPMNVAAVGLVGGIIADHWLQAALWVYVSSLLLVTVVATFGPIRQRCAPVIVIVAAAAGGATIHAVGERSPDPRSIAQWATPEGRIARISGTVNSKPEVRTPPPHPFARWTFGSDNAAFVLRCAGIEAADGMMAARGLVRVVVRDPVLGVRLGERIEVFGTLHTFEPPSNPGEFDFAAHQQRQGIVARMLARHADNVRLLPGALRGTGVAAWWQHVRGRFGALLVDGIGGEEQGAGGGFLQAIILGQRSQIDRQLNEIFIRAGCAHFIAVSGVHVAIVLALIGGACMLLGLSPRSTTVFMLVGMLVYAGVAEPRPSILRAATMAALYCIARLLYRGSASLNWLGVAAILLLIIRPTYAFDVGFQLSFAAVLGVTRLSPAIAAQLASVHGVWRRWRFGPYAHQDDALVRHIARTGVGWRYRAMRLARSARRTLGTSLIVSLSAWLACLPIVACHFHRVQPWAPISSVLMLPLVSLLMLLGFAKILIAAVYPSVAAYIDVALNSILQLNMNVAEWMSELQYTDTPMPAPPTLLAVTYYLLLVALILRPRIQPSFDDLGTIEYAAAPDRSRAWRVATAIILIALVGQTGVWARAQQSPGKLTLTVLDVGAGLATVIQTPGGPCLLYDGGSMSPYDPGAHTIVPFLRSRGITRIDRAYASHANLDHYSGLPTVHEHSPIETITINPYFERDAGARTAARHLLNLMDESNVNRTTIDHNAETLAIDGVRIRCLWPPPKLPEHIATNDTSTVLRIDYAGRSILLTGDIERYGQEQLLGNPQIHADVLVLPHHGGVVLNTESFIHTVDPAAVIRSSNQRMAQTTNGLAEAVGSVPLFNTADHGAITISIDHTGLRVEPYRNTRRQVHESAPDR